MSIKRILAAAAASVVAVSAMAVVASAGKITTSLDNVSDDGSGNYQIDLIKAGFDFSKMASFDVTFSFETMIDADWVGGAVVTQCDAASWKELGQFCMGGDGTKAFENVESGKAFHVDVADALAADSTYAFITLQSYSNIDINLDNIVVYDAAGTVLYDMSKGVSGGDSTPESKPDESKTEDNKTDENKPNVDTGVEGVAAVVGVAAVAAGALVVAKKRK